MNGKVFRRFHRKETRQRALFKSKRGVALTVMMVDISPSGCLVQVKYQGLKAGDIVSIRPETFEVIPGVVRWSSGDKAGIEFETPLHSSVVDHLVKTAMTEADEHRRKNFGIAESWGRRLLPVPTVAVVRSVA